MIIAELLPWISEHEQLKINVTWNDQTYWNNYLEDEPLSPYMFIFVKSAYPEHANLGGIQFTATQSHLWHRQTECLGTFTIIGKHHVDDIY